MHLGGAHAHAGVGAELDHVRHRHLELQAADLLGQRLDLGLGGGTVVGGGGRSGGGAGTRRGRPPARGGLLGEGREGEGGQQEEGGEAVGSGVWGLSDVENDSYYHT